MHSMENSIVLSVSTISDHHRGERLSAVMTKYAGTKGANPPTAYAINAMRECSVCASTKPTAITPIDA